MNLTEQELETIQLNRDYAQAERDEAAALAAAVEACIAFFAAHKKRHNLGTMRAQAMKLPVPPVETHWAKNHLGGLTFYELEAWGLLMRAKRDLTWTPPPAPSAPWAT